MRKSGWAAATGLGSLVLLLAACGGSSSSSNTAGAAASGTASSTAVATSSASGSSSSSTSTSASASASNKASKKASPHISATPHNTAGPQPSSGTVTFNPHGTTIMIVQHSSLGYVLAEANGQVVYVYSKDKKNGAPTCTGSCASQWPPVTGTPKAGPADTFPGSFGVVKGSGGVEQVTYDGLPLYTYAGAKAYVTTGNGVDNEWKVVPLSASDISG
jgi:predicted lipoprotein with Yx(FWY)xxD motif